MIEKQELKKESLLLWIYAAVILMHLITPKIYGFEGRPWIDENGNVTDLININPDPDGEPWIVGGMKLPTDEELRFMETVPELTTTRNIMERTLPEEIILIDNDEFPEIFNQVGGSCGQASGIGYTYSYQWNVLKGVTSTKDNNRAYGFTYNFLNNGGPNKGSWYWDGWEILTKVGAPSVTTFHGSADGGYKNSRWMHGADRWHAANVNRALSYRKIVVKTMDDIQKIKNWMYDLNGTDPHKKGGCVVFSANAQSATGSKTISSGPHAGEMICTSLTNSPMNHAMTFAGYSDNVAGGALLLLNSWGKSWSKKGYVWVPYTKILNNGLYKNEVWCVTVGENKPVYELRATVTHEQRNQMQLQTGVADGVASKPTVIKKYAKAFNFSGGTVPMQGLTGTGSSTIEISLDASEFYDEINSNDATFFLKVTNKSGTCKVKNLTLIDYTGSTPIEYPSVQTNVSISSNDSTLIPVTYNAKVSRYFLTATAQGNGTISPEGITKVNSGTDLKYTMKPDTWHRIDSVIVDGTNVGSDSIYTFTDIKSDHTIAVYFSWDPNTPDLFTIVSKNKKNGNISPTDSLTTTMGSDTTISITPSTWYHVDSVLVNGKNCGPLISAHFSYLTANHTIEPFYSTKDYGNQYPLWGKSKNYSEGDTVKYNGHLWEAKWWNQNAQPGGSGGEWKDLGKVLSPEDDTLTIALLDYISNKQMVDTLIITTKKIFKGDTTTVIDTIAEKVSINSAMIIPNSVHGYFLSNGSQFYAPQKGVYTVTLFDVRGRVITQMKIHAHDRGINSIPIEHVEISNGTYLLQLTGKNTNIIRKFIF